MRGDAAAGVVVGKGGLLKKAFGKGGLLFFVGCEM
jgi:hypothetical protein